MSDAELTEIAKRICNQGWVNVANASHIKLLRSIEIAALREAREIVEKKGDDDGLGVMSILDNLTAKIQELELQ